jgi:hypothetical protein
LADHEHDGNDGTLAVARDGPHLALEIHEGSTTNETSLVLKLLLHLLNLHSDVWVVGRKSSELGQDGSGLLPVILFGEEARRLVAEENTNNHEDGWKHLHGQRNLPLSVTLGVFKRTKVDPEGHHDTECDVELVNTSHATSN